jgi:hypothetical protein
VKECALADVPAAKTPPSIALEIRPQRGYISGYPGALWVAFVNRSASEVDMVFEHRCLFWDPGNLFDLEATNDRGESAMLDVFRPKVGILGALDVDCPKPYVGAKVPAGGRITIGFFLDASALEQVGPGLPPGALAPGIYSVEVTTPLVQRPSLKGTFRMNVGVMRKE